MRAIGRAARQRESIEKEMREDPGAREGDRGGLQRPDTKLYSKSQSKK